MRILKIFLGILLPALLICCKSKDKSAAIDKLLNKNKSDSSQVTQKDPVQKDLSTRDMLLRKWKMTDATPLPESAEERADMLNTIFEFTRDGKVMVTQKGNTKEEASFTLSMDEKYILSKDNGRDKIDTLHIRELTPAKLILESKEHGDNMRIVAEPVK